MGAENARQKAHYRIYALDFCLRLTLFVGLSDLLNMCHSYQPSPALFRVLLERSQHSRAVLGKISYLGI